MKTPYTKKKFRVPVFIDYADMRFSNFASEDLCKTKKLLKQSLPVHMGPR